MFKIESFRHTDFLAILKWKQGERAALTTFRPGPSRLHVLFDLPPAGDFDHEKWRWASTDHHLTVNVEAIAEMYGMVKVAPTVAPEPAAKQIEMFSDLESPATVPEPQLERVVESESPDDKKE
jgi:hypothetical protein